MEILQDKDLEQEFKLIKKSVFFVFLHGLARDVASPAGQQLISYERRNALPNFWICDTAEYRIAY